jgi:hypothetical protein
VEFYSRSNSGMLLIYNESISVHIPTYEAFRKELKFDHTDHSSHVESIARFERIDA